MRPWGIRGKIIGIVLGVILCLTLLTILYVRYTLHTTLAEQLDQTAISITRDTAGKSVEPILTNNVYALHRLAHSTLENHDDVRYVFFQDGQGDILAHTFAQGVSPDLLTANTIAEHEDYSLKHYNTEEGVLRDVAVPVFDGAYTVARIGILDHSIQAALSRVTQQLLFIATVTFIITSIIIYLLTTLTAVKPLSSLLSSVQAVSKGDLSRQVSIHTGDELTQLAESFNTMTHHLAHAQRTRDLLMKKLVHSQEEERRRISRELHDETGQSLMTLMLTLGLLENAKDEQERKQKIEDLRRLLMDSLEQVRTMAWRLTPAPLENMGLKAALESFVAKYKNCKINLHLDELNEERLPHEMESALYRVAQEAVTNAVKHAQAQTVDIFLGSTEQEILMIIEDNGTGFITEKETQNAYQEKGMGLVSMKERVSLVGGTLKIDSTPQEGTAIYIRVPLPGKGDETHFSANSPSVGR